MSSDEQQPRWFTPVRCLALFCTINVLNYMDRGIIASNAVKDSIGAMYHLNNFQYFMLPSVFMVGLLLASPVFAQLTHTCNPLRLIGVGLSVWMVATMGCACAWNYPSLVAARMLVGVGEASFCSLAAPLIDEIAPKGQKSTWLAIFFMCIPSGIALGYVVGGVMYGVTGSWRYAFALESLCMLPFAVFGFVATPMRLARLRSASTEPLLGRSPSSDEDPRGGDHVGSGNSQLTTHPIQDLSHVPSRVSSAGVVAMRFVRQWSADMHLVFSHRVFAMACLGYITYTACTGVLINAGPSAAAAMFPDDFQGVLSIDEFFGLVTMLTGVVGTAGGGIILDRVLPTVRGAMLLSAIGAGAATILLLLCFTIRKLEAFMACFVLAELALFSVSGPVNAGYMWSVPPELKPLACALTTVAIHVFGDVPSPPLAGRLVDHLRDSGYTESAAWQLTMMVSFGGIGLSTILWGLGALCARTARDYGSGVCIEPATLDDLEES